MSHVGILLLNLGTPAAPTRRAVATYLREFLGDGRVIDLPVLWRKLLVNGLIIPLRAGKSAAAYRKIWTAAGSPLRVNSEQLAQALQAALPGELKVALGMRYGQPNTAAAIRALLPCRELIILPLYPQYASSSSGSAIEAALRSLSQETYIPKLTVINQFYTHPAYINAMATHIRAHLQDDDYDTLLFSYHGIPVRQEKRLLQTVHPLESLGYQAQCEATTRLIASSLPLPANRYETSFQSRLGKLAWLEPYTTDKIEALAAQGKKRLAVVCPSFFCDCLETLEEIGMALKKDWLARTQGTFHLIPALNASEQAIQALKSICLEPHASDGA